MVHVEDLQVEKKLMYALYLTTLRRFVGQLCCALGWKISTCNIQITIKLSSCFTIEWFLSIIVWKNTAEVPKIYSKRKGCPG